MAAPHFQEMSYQIRPHLERARRLIEAGDERSFVYAALELRLGLELVCYEKLRMRLEYVSATEIADWRPRQVLEALEDLTDPNIFQDAILHVAEEPVSEEPKTWIKVCEQKALDAKRLSSIWNQLGSYLHVQKPQDHHASVRAYPDAHRLKKSLSALVDELEPLASGSDIHFAASRTQFACSCGFRVQRATATLRHHQLITCINPECRKEWVVQEEGEGRYSFRTNAVEVTCKKCGHQHPLAHRDLREMRPSQLYRFTCGACGAVHRVRRTFEYALDKDAGSG